MILKYSIAKKTNQHICHIFSKLSRKIKSYELQYIEQCLTYFYHQANTKNKASVNDTEFVKYKCGCMTKKSQ